MRFPYKVPGFKLPLLPVPIAVAAFLAILALSVLGATGISIEKDITALLPNRGSTSLLAHARRFGMMRKVAVVIGPVEPDAADRLFVAADSVANALSRLKGVASVVNRVDMAEAQKAASVILSKAARLTRPDTAPKGRDEYASRIKALKMRLGSPEAIVIEDYLLKDPLGLGRDALKGLEAVGEGQGARVERGHLVSLDGRHVLVFAELSFDPLDADRSMAFVKALDRAISGSMKAANAADIRVVVLGGVHFAAASASTLIADLKWSSVAIAVLVGGVFLFFFRRLRLLPLALIPGLLGNAVALGVMGFAGQRVHALTLGFASTITGVSIDYAIHLFHRALGETTGDTKARMAAALRAVVKPVSLGCGTGVAAFLLVATSAFTSVRQLALFSAISIAVSLLATLFLLPSFHKLLLGGPGTGLRNTSERWSTWFMRIGGGEADPNRRAAVTVVFIATSLLGAYGVYHVSFSGDPRDLSYTPPPLLAAQSELARLFPGLSDQLLLVAEAGTQDEALRKNDQLYTALTAAHFDERHIVSVSPFIPSRASQTRSLAVSAKILSKQEAVPEFLAAGFSPSYIDGLASMLDVPPIAPSDFKDTSLERLVGESITSQNGRWYVLTRVMATSEIEKLKRIAASVPGCRLFSERLEARDTLSTLHREVSWMLGIWCAAALVIITLIERSFRFGLRALLPPSFGVLVAIGLYGLLGRPLTPIASAALTMVLGLGIDYGIYVEHEPLAERGRVAAAVFADALTTIVGFLVLAFARNRAMSDIGLIIVVGLTAAMMCAMLVLPALPGRRRQS